MDKVVWDINAYRYFVTNRSDSEVEKAIQNLNTREKANNIESSFSVIVAQELLSHIADRTDPYFAVCMKAIKALYKYNGDSTEYRVMATQDLQISRIFFDSTLPSKVAHCEAIGRMLSEFASDPTPHVFIKHQQNLNRIKAEVYRSEQNFISDILHVIRKLDPTSTSWQLFANDPVQRKGMFENIRSESFKQMIGIGYIVATYAALKETGLVREHSDEELGDMAKAFASFFPEPIALFQELYE
ncbi:hypothetical protein [Paraflavitalea pollutisoli]|uniref:hypothetical protein n=1 Tax=Paraflavitalea pollutisoli TaxID=3034143 RepID=UPI0023EE289C|nr:hypothetical protein [Paraflavitalea sp. H1-2-19X]